MSLLERLLSPDIVWILIPLAAIALVGTLLIMKTVIRHRERMAKIGMGIDPDVLPNVGQSQPDGRSRIESSH